MSELSVKVAREHDITVRVQEARPPGWRQPVQRSTVYDCKCGTVGLSLDGIASHLIAVTEAAVRETIAADIETSPHDHGMDHLTTKRHCARIAKGES